MCFGVKRSALVIESEAEGVHRVGMINSRILPCPDATNEAGLEFRVAELFSAGGQLEGWVKSSSLARWLSACESPES